MSKVKYIPIVIAVGVKIPNLDALSELYTIMEQETIGDIGTKDGVIINYEGSVYIEYLKLNGSIIVRKIEVI